MLTGRLRRNDAERLELYRHEDYTRIPLPSGTALEVLDAGRWIPGRIEYGPAGYYFSGLGPNVDPRNYAARLPEGK
jgi:Domain of unknown function (DUF5348)